MVVVSVSVHSLVLMLVLCFDITDHCVFNIWLREWVESADLSCGVPQGSVLGAILFTFYLHLLGYIINRLKGISYHYYADDIQLYLPF